MSIVGVALIAAACSGTATSGQPGKGGDAVGTGTNKAVGATGGTLQTASGNAALNIPANALAGNVSLSIQAIDPNQTPAKSAIASKVASTVYDFGPNNTQFAVPISMAIKTTTAPGTGEKAVLAYLDNTSKWQVVPNSSYNAATGTVSAPVTHFTVFAVIIVQADGTGCNEQADPNAYCAPLLCGSANDKCVPKPNTYQLGGTVTGLSGTLTLSDASAGSVTIAGDGNFTFNNALVDTTAYSVTVIAQPAGQVCTVANGQGAIAAADVSSIAVTCVSYFAVSGTVSGMNDGVSVGLANGNDTLTVAGNTNFTFGVSEASGGTYAVVVATQPNFQTCSVQNGNGTLTNANVTNVTVSCINNAFSLGGHVSGLRPDAQLALFNGNDTLNANNGAYTFATQVPYGANYNVTFASPAGYSCTFAPNAVANANMMSTVSGVDVVCTLLPYNLGGRISGLTNGAIVTLSNGVDINIPSTNGNYVFPTPLDSEDPYDVIISSPPGETCDFDFNVVSQGNMPAGDVLGINIVCVPQPYNLGVSVTGLVANANVSVTNGNDALSVRNGNITFPTAVTFGSSYNITFMAPTGHTCQFGNGAPGAGIMPAANVGNVLLNCAPITYGITVNVSGLVNGAQVSLLSGANAPTVGNGNTTFASQVAFGSPYNVSLSPPPGETCQFGGGGTSASGTMAASVLSLTVACTPVNYHISGSVGGLVANANLTVRNGNDAVPLYNGAFAFPTAVAFGANYNVTLTVPAGQSCSFGTSPNGVMGAQNVTLAISCSPDTYTLGGLVAGLAGGANVTLTNAGQTINAGNGNYAFGTQVAYNSNYAIGLGTPAGHACAFATSGNGTMGVGGASVAINCNALKYAIAGSVSGLLNSATVTLTNGSDSVTPTNGAYTFPTSLSYGASYNANLTSPAGQSCSYSGNANGTVGAANITLNVTCLPKAYAVTASVSGLVTNTNVTLTNGSDTLHAVNGNTPFQTSVSYNSTYAIGITSPAAQNCNFATTGNGTVGAANVTVAITCVPSNFAIAGTISGLLTSTNVTIVNGGDNISRTNGAYVLPTSVTYGANYNVLLTSPTGQSCGVTTANANGMMGNGNLTVNINCTTNNYTVFTSVSGLVANANVVLTNNVNGNTVSMGNANGQFPSQLAYNSNYAITAGALVGQNCVVASPNGTMSNANVTIVVACSPNNYALSGTISGLLPNVNLTVQNGSDNISAPNGPFTLPLSVAYNSNYAISYSQPFGQTCQTTNGNGPMGNANVTNIGIACNTNTYTIRGTVTGLVASASATLAQGGDSLTVSNGNYVFPTKVAYQQNYNIIITPPNGQNCNVIANEALAGTMSVGDINVAIVCQPNQYSLGGRVTNLVTSDNVTIYNGSDSLSTNNGAYTLPSLVGFNSNYNVTVVNATGQSCTVSNATGQMGAGNVTNANINCTPNSYSLIGSVSGLVAGAQATLVNNGTDTISAGNGNTPFANQVAYNSSYSVTFTPPNGQHCVIASPSGTMGGGNVYIGVACSPNTYSISGSVSGLVANANLTVYNGNDSIALYNGAFTMPAPVAFNANYAISATAPGGQTCSFSGSPNTGVMAAANVTGITVTCSQLSYHVVGVVSGLVNNANVLITNGSDNNFPSHGNYTLPTPVTYNASYSVSLTSPAGQTCAANGSSLTGTMGSTNAIVNVACTPNPYQVGGQVVGLITGTNVTLGNGNDSITSSNGTYVMPTPVNYFSNYNVTIANPTGQLCTFDGGTGAGLMGSSNVTTLNVTCQPASYSIVGAVSGLLANSVGITNGSDDIQSGNGNFMLPTQVGYQSPYQVTLTSPSGQNCNITSGPSGGAMTAGNVTLRITCQPKTYFVGGRVTGLVANTNVTIYSGSDTIQSPNGVYQMPTSVAYMSNYNITVASPPGQTCLTTSYHTGVMAAKSVTNANINCTPNTYTISGAVSGLLNSASVTINNSPDSMPTTNGNFTLTTPVTYPLAYSVTLVPPSGQHCAVTGGAAASGNIGPANIGNLLIACSPNTYTVGGNISGLVTATSLTITSANDTFTQTNGDYNMPVQIAYASNYNYTVTPPAGQTCTYASSGNTHLVATMAANHVHDANLTCLPIHYTVGGSVSGLLPSTTITLSNSPDSISVGNASYSFPTTVAYATSYNASLTQPTGQNCSWVGNGNAGTMPAANVGNANVTCVPIAYTLGGHVTGLISNANVVVTNGLDSVSLYNGAYTFATSVGYTSTYNIGITSPAGQSCTFSTPGAGSGAMTAANITDRDIACVQLPYSLGGAVSGLLASTSVSLLNGSDNISVSNGNYTFPGQINFGSTYNASIANPVGQSCTYTNPSNAAMVANGVTNLNVSCTQLPYAIGGTVSGLTGTVVLGNGNDSQSVASNTSYVMPKSVPYQTGYNVTVLTQPTAQLCAVSNGVSSGISNANVTNINVSCQNAYAIGGTVTGLPVDTNVQLTNTVNSDTLTVTWKNPTFMMPQIMADGSSYNVTVASQPPGMNCVAATNSGTLAGGNITNVAVACSLQLSFNENQNAILVVGQSSFTSASAGTSSTTLRSPSGAVYMAPDGNVYISDTGNKRILGFTGRPTSNGQAGSFVIGQSDMVSSTSWPATTPRATVDAAQGGSGNGNVTAFADSFSSRVLIYPGNPNSNVAGVYALGQPDLVTGTTGCTAAKLNAPAGVFVNNGNFIVADTKNHRVLIWTAQPAASGVSANVVLGQPDMVTCSLAGSPDATNFQGPQGVWTNGTLFAVADTSNNRVLVWNTFPQTNQQAADAVVGQPDFVSTDNSDTTTTLSAPSSITSDGHAFFVVERFNNRVSGWGPIGSPALEFVLGQSDITLNHQSCNQGNASPASNSLCTPSGVGIIGTSLYVTDVGNNRVVVYKSN